MADLGLDRRLAARRRTVLVGLALALVAAAVLAAGVGAVPIPAAQVAATLWRPAAAPPTVATILWQVRLPRVAMAILVGAALGVAGGAYQGLLRNPLADPYLLGVSGGASLGAALALALGATQAVPLFAFAGAALASVVVYGLARSQGQVSSLGLILAGVATSAFTGAVISYLLTTGPDWLQKSLLSWLSGGLGAASWERLGLMAPYLLAGLAGLMLFSRDLNLLLLGDEAALHSGLAVTASRGWVLGLASLVTAAAVSVTGLIGFVGLVVPHMIRLALGADHRFLLPAAALGGGLFLLLADTLGRTLWAPAEVRVSVIAGLAGAPYFLFLLRRHLARSG